MTVGSSFERGLAVLAAIREDGPLRADQLAERLEIPLSTVYRYLKSLRSAGFVEEEQGRYWSAAGTGADAELVRRARPLLERLGAATGETALLTVRSGLRAVCLDQAFAPAAQGNVFPLHQPLPIYAGASKRLLLAYSPQRLRDRVLGARLERFTPASPDVPRLRELLVHSRKRGVAVSHGEFIPGSLAVAVPVLRAGKLVGALTVSGRSTRCDRAWAGAALHELRRASAELEWGL
ncbi:IclR family transcriptional regulator [Tamaricihabitans halophyticus]|uniref:IclR family transcriptional regulator n=1 Tax=Tamaricihabitans halophyticus TaxID=1262583 RepID=A0A4R2QQG7_9PSEU|nr:IclR family transcriptional regulator [Tamaricihabitans halophyticus]TCP51982.1 IclR family transcriptional regulator [Tamaricihabitans halophyticus]